MGAPEEQPGRVVRELRPHPGTIVLVFTGSLARPSIAGLCDHVRLLLQGCQADEVICDVGALVDPDAVTVDALARVQLTVRQLGKQVRFRQACGELRDLLSLMGLSDVVSLCPESRLGPRGQAEQREQAVGIEEEADPADPAP